MTSPFARVPRDAWLVPGAVAFVAFLLYVVPGLVGPYGPFIDELYYVAWFDMFRLQNGKIAEHWDAAAKGELRAGTLPEAAAE